jgi:hypothetical protein
MVFTYSHVGFLARGGLLETSFFDHENSPWHARRMAQATPKTWGTLAPSSSCNLHIMSDTPICWGPTSSDATSRKMGLTAILD